MTDYIKREAAKRCVNEHYDDAIIMALDALPAADVALVRHGKWKRVRFQKCDDPDGGYWIVRCSQCSIPEYKEFRYCPNCGAKMDE